MEKVSTVIIFCDCQFVRVIVCFENPVLRTGSQKEASARSCILCLTRPGKTKPWLPARLPGQGPGSSAKPPVSRVVVYFRVKNTISNFSFYLTPLGIFIKCL